MGISGRHRQSWGGDSSPHNYYFSFTWYNGRFQFETFHKLFHLPIILILCKLENHILCYSSLCVSVICAVLYVLGAYAHSCGDQKRMLNVFFHTPLSPLPWEAPLTESEVHHSVSSAVRGAPRIHLSLPQYWSHRHGESCLDFSLHWVLEMQAQVLMLT